MHAGIDELMRLRDGEDTGAAVRAHVHACPHCQAELARLGAVSRDLRELPSSVTPPERWSAINATLAGETLNRMPRRRPGWFIPAASAALVLVAVLFTVRNHRPDATPSSDSVAADMAPLHESRQALVAESQRLESLLASLPTEPRLTRAQTALTVADLEDRIQWVDYRLGLASEAGLAAEPAHKLWRERVDLMNSLVAVRYAEARTVAF